MRKATVWVNDIEAGIFEALNKNTYRFTYHENYKNAPVSLTMPITQTVHAFDRFPPFFEGLLPEGVMLEGLLHQYKLDKHDLFAQLMKVGRDLVGAISVKAIP